MTAGLDLDSYTLRFTSRSPWHETDLYTYCVPCILQTVHRDL